MSLVAQAAARRPGCRQSPPAGFALASRGATGWMAFLKSGPLETNTHRHDFLD